MAQGQRQAEVTVRRAASFSEVRLRIAPVAVNAGFPSPAQDYYDGDLNLNEHLIRDPDTTFIVTVTGESMIQAGIAPGDLLIVDCSRQAVSGSIVVAILDGELAVKQLWLERGTGAVLLKSANPRFPDFRIPQLSELSVWGVVTHCIHRFTSA